ncbi:MAG: hypothetical protein JO200_19135 [Comamonas sp.]|nr:hypothetical protein [Comamonas sp.]
MAVVIANSQIKPVVECPATLFIPIDGGKFAEHKFTAQFHRLKKDERDALQKQFVSGEIKTEQLLDKIVAGWGGMLDETGQPVPYSHAERVATEAVFSGMEEAMAISWFDHFFVHQRAAAEKNFGAPSSTTSGSMAPGVTS